MKFCPAFSHAHSDTNQRFEKIDFRDAIVPKIYKQGSSHFNHNFLSKEKFFMVFLLKYSLHIKFYNNL